MTSFHFVLVYTVVINIPMEWEWTLLMIGNIGIGSDLYLVLKVSILIITPQSYDQS